jgi:HEPN domain-containing protein
MAIKYIGHRRKTIDICYEYLKLSKEDEDAGNLLLEQNRYRHSCYFFVQAMEKFVRYAIFKKVNASNEWFIDKTRTHNLDDLLEFLIEIVSTKEAIREQVKLQLDQFVLNGVRFGQLHNELRYPLFNLKTKQYTILDIEKIDAEHSKKKLNDLKIFLRDIEKLR